MKKKRLSDAYRFKGFVPEQMVHETFEDLQGRLIKLKRRQKKLFVPNANIPMVRITIAKKDEYVICRAVNSAYILNLKYGAFSVNRAEP